LSVTRGDGLTSGRTRRYISTFPEDDAFSWSVMASGPWRVSRRRCLLTGTGNRPSSNGKNNGKNKKWTNNRPCVDNVTRLAAPYLRYSVQSQHQFLHWVHRVHPPVPRQPAPLHRPLPHRRSRRLSGLTRAPSDENRGPTQRRVHRDPRAVPARIVIGVRV
jgi:hypothetical protein